MDDEEYQHTQKMLMTVARFVAPLDLDSFISRIVTAEATGPILNPSLYLVNGAKLRALKEMAEAALKFQDAAEALHKVAARRP